ncbi:hypothetical protein DER46DRAFT_561822 [Fusarium sp. MPI-SDFR-AT-0072]|nr:hypothetical protein DER46DRAFT_561822 [Fusarium sp. MPI-SDFR-AT-0072]
MASPLSEMLDYLWKPPRKEPAVKSRALNRFDVENFKYYKNWGFTIYRTYYGQSSDKHWSTLLDALSQQTRLAVGYYDDKDIMENDKGEDWTEEVLWQKDSQVPPVYQCKTQKEYTDDLNRLKELFHLDTREDPSFDGLSIRQIREVCVDDAPENEETTAGYQFRYVLLADKAVFQAMERGEFIIKVVAYDWEEGGEYWGWMRIPTGYLLDFWYALMRLEDYVHRVIRFEGPEEDLEKYVWPGGVNLYGTGSYSEVRRRCHYDGQKNGFEFGRKGNTP